MADRSCLDDLATPVAVVDREVVVRNLGTWADAIQRHGVALRPHAKTHKTVELARLQLEHGAGGLTVAKPSEGLALLPSGVDDLMVAYPVVGTARIAQLVALTRRIRTRSCLDDLAAARSLSVAAQEAGLVLEVLVDVDSGLQRTGRVPAEAVALGRGIAALPGLELTGVFTYAGYPANDPDASVRRDWARREAQTAVEVAAALRGTGIGIETVSVGGTPTARFAAEIPGVTEVRPGIYALGDANYRWLGVVGEEELALRVLATVVSRPAPGRAVVDAGSKALAADPGLDAGTFGWLPQHPRSRLTRLWEEHGALELAAEDADLAVGDRVAIVPNHVCPAVNLASDLVCVEQGRVVDRWEVVAR